MSVEYKSALIYGFDCSHCIEDFPWEFREKWEDAGWDIISDCYDDKFLYIGKIISNVSLGEEVRVDCEYEAQQADIYLEELLAKIPVEWRALLPRFSSIYHLCYAT